MSRFVIAFCLVSSFIILASCRQPQVIVSPESEETSMASQSELLYSAPGLTTPTLVPKLSGGEKLEEMVSININSYSEEPVSLQVPAYIEAEIVGRDISKVRRITAVIGSDGIRRVLTNDYAINHKTDSVISEWAVGVNEIVQVWSTEGDYLSDGTSGDFVVLWPTEPGSALHTVNGQYHSTTTGERSEAMLVVDVDQGRAQQLIDVTSGQQIDPITGDAFQITNLFLDNQANIITDTGISLSIDTIDQIVHEIRPLPSGQYLYGLSAETSNGESAIDLVEFTVGNDNLRSGFRALFDPDVGYQFLYPSDWTKPTFKGSQLISHQISDTMKLTISTIADAEQKPISEFKAQILESFGAVQILYEDTAPIGEAGSLWTAYGYESADGPRSGVFLVFTHNDAYFVIDVDGPASLEGEVIKTVDWLSSSWVARPVSTDQKSGEWQTSNLEEFTIAMPSTYRYSLLQNEWHRFRAEDEITFIALKIEDSADGMVLDRVRHWLDVAAQDVNEFAFSEIYTIDVAGKSWLRQEFSYQKDDDEEIYGSIMAARFGDKLIYTWAEAPQESHDEFDREKLLIAISGLQTNLAADVTN